MELTKAQIEQSVTNVILSDAQKKGALNPVAIAKEFKDAGIDVEIATVTKASFGINSNNYKWQAQVSDSPQAILISKETGNIINLSNNPQEAYQLVSGKTSAEELTKGKPIKLGSANEYTTVYKADSPQKLQKKLDFIMEQANRGNSGPLQKFMGDDGSTPKNIADHFVHPDIKNAVEAGLAAGVVYTGSELTPPPSTPTAPQQQIKTR